jgi:SAM-dependent methyltransferase
MRAKPDAPATGRNAAAILDVLRYEFRNADTVLEIGSGTGQHAVRFAAALRHLDWQTSDLQQNHDGILAWIEDSGPANVRAPLSLDVRTAEPTAETYSAAYSANTAHIMDIAAVEKMFALVSSSLRDGGVFCLYGPFRVGGAFSSASNAEFDHSLRQRDPSMGIRDLEELGGFAEAGGMQRLREYAMPANNMLVVWMKSNSGAENDDA